VKAPRWLVALGRRARAPLWIWWNLATAALGQRIGHFADRRATTPARRLVWRLLLTLVLLVKAPAMFALALLLAALLAIGVPTGLLGTYLYGSLREIWRD
jgi:hypothetical protein